MRTLTTADVDEMRPPGWRIRTASQFWHEGTELVGYWPEGGSYIFKGDGHYLCVSEGYIKKIARRWT